MVLYEAATFCQTLFGCEIASASLVQPIIIVYLPAVATTVFTPKPIPNIPFGQIKNHYTSLHQLCFVPKLNYIQKTHSGIMCRIPLSKYPALFRHPARPCHPAKGTKVPCTDGSAKAGKSQGVCKGTWQLRFIQPP